ncbi:hypothetical protein DFP72DRAFT_847980 [Ephemerocybe angulata]|uniref:Uncharacterized protein n=1 Tax=Ephemerocybe angulata TaxID=980116 RepID=A0A8H6HXG2_9AGAR|nr:hypothetical protein DFP72DRAFT_847980 [Tulosesus angulatus]
MSPASPQPARGVHLLPNASNDVAFGQCQMRPTTWRPSSESLASNDATGLALPPHHLSRTPQPRPAPQPHRLPPARPLVREFNGPRAIFVFVAQPLRQGGLGDAMTGDTVLRPRGLRGTSRGDEGVATRELEVYHHGPSIAPATPRPRPLWASRQPGNTSTNPPHLHHESRTSRNLVSTPVVSIQPTQTLPHLDRESPSITSAPLLPSRRLFIVYAHLWPLAQPPPTLLDLPSIPAKDELGSARRPAHLADAQTGHCESTPIQSCQINLGSLVALVIPSGIGASDLVIQRAEYRTTFSMERGRTSPRSPSPTTITASSIGFAEVIVPIVALLKKSLKVSAASKNGSRRERGFVKTLLERTEDSAKRMEQMRRDGFAPRQMSHVLQWEAKLREGLLETRLVKYVKAAVADVGDWHVGGACVVEHEGSMGEHADGGIYAMARTSTGDGPFAYIFFERRSPIPTFIRYSRSPVWVWDAKLLFHVHLYEMAFKVRLSILDWDKLSANDHIGNASFNVSELLASAPDVAPGSGTAIIGIVRARIFGVMRRGGAQENAIFPPTMTRPVKLTVNITGSNNVDLTVNLEGRSLLRKDVASSLCAITPANQDANQPRNAGLDVSDDTVSADSGSTQDTDWEDRKKRRKAALKRAKKRATPQEVVIHSNDDTGEPLESYANDIQAVEEALQNSHASFQELRSALRVAFLVIQGLRGQVQDLRDDLAEAMVELEDIKATKRVRRRKKKAGEGSEEEPDDDDLIARLAKFYVIFFSPFTGDHLFSIADEDAVGWTSDDIQTRFDRRFPKNPKIGEALDLLACAEPQMKERIRAPADLSFKKEFKAAAERERTQAARRARACGPDIFRDLQDRIANEIARHVPPLTLRKTRDGAPRKLSGYGKDLFTPDAGVCRACLSSITEVIGIQEMLPGQYKSNPFCPLIYKSYEEVDGNEFMNDALFCLGRALIYGETFTLVHDALVLNKNNPISGYALRATPGFIAFVATLARIILSPDGSFTRDGKGPTTKIDWLGDFWKSLKFLLEIWSDDSDNDIAEEWNKNVFPTYTRGPPSTPASPAAYTAPQDTDTDVDERVARSRRARQERQLEEEEVPFTFPSDQDPNDDSMMQPHGGQEYHYSDEENDSTAEEEEYDEETGLFYQRNKQSNLGSPSPSIQSSTYSERNWELAGPLAHQGPAPQTETLLRRRPPPIPPRRSSQNIPPPTSSTASAASGGPILDQNGDHSLFVAGQYHQPPPHSSTRSDSAASTLDGVDAARTPASSETGAGLMSGPGDSLPGSAAAAAARMSEVDMDLISGRVSQLSVGEGEGGASANGAGARRRGKAKGNITRGTVLGARPATRSTRSKKD